MKTKVKSEYHFQTIQKKDLSKIIKIASQSNPSDQIKKEFQEILECPSSGCILATKGTKLNYTVVGFALYKMYLSHIDILHIGVDEKHLRQKIGSGLINYLTLKLDSNNRKLIETHVSETNLGMQLFLKENGFKAIKIIKNKPDDLYLFKYNFI